MSDPKPTDASHILVVDDEEDVLCVLTDLVRADGYRVTGTTDPQEALALVRQEVIDLVIVDLMMPKMSGWRLLKSLKTYDTKLPVIVLTGFINEQSESILTNQQADSYLIKPVDNQRLYKLLQTFLSPSLQSSPTTIVIVDDDPDTQRIVDHVLSRRNLTVTAFDDISPAFEYIHTNVPDLIILDLIFPNANGFDLCAKLQEHPETSDIPVIILTAQASRGNLMKAIGYGVRGFLAKPFAPNALADRVAHVLRQG